jgi:chromosome segregation ATPase
MGKLLRRICVEFEYDDEPSTAERLARIESSLNKLHRRLKTMSTKFDGLIAEVADLNTVTAGAIVLLDELKARIDEAAGDPAAIAQIVADIDASKDALAAALVRNTPAEGEPVA